MALLSVVLSFRNEQENIPVLIDRLTATLSPLQSQGLDHELVFVNDDSNDRSLEILMERAKTNSKIKVVTTSRPFGVSECQLAGIRYGKGDAFVYMDTDLQDPPELIPQMVEQWKKGFDVVHTVRTRRKGEFFLKIWVTRLAYKIIGHLSEIQLPNESGDYKLITRRVADALLAMNDRTLYLRGLVRWIGFKQTDVHYDRDERSAGTSHFPILKRVTRDLATFHGPVGALAAGIISFSMIPLVLFFFAGLIVTALGLVSGVITGVGDAATGIFTWQSLLWPAAFTVLGANLTGLGVIGFYLAGVYREARKRPHYIVASTHGVELAGPSR